MTHHEPAPPLDPDQFETVARFGIHAPEVGVAVAALNAVVAAALAAQIAIAERMLLAIEPLFPPRTRRKLRKKRKLAAHHSAKIDRVPAWKRSI